MSCCGRKNKTVIGRARTAIIGSIADNRSLMIHVQRWRKPEDIGLGDTLKHIAEHFGAEKFAGWLKKWGVDCGCENERQYWNEKMPYSEWDAHVEAH